MLAYTHLRALSCMLWVFPLLQRLVRSIFSTGLVPLLEQGDNQSLSGAREFVVRWVTSEAHGGCGDCSERCGSLSELTLCIQGSKAALPLEYCVLRRA